MRRLTNLIKSALKFVPAADHAGSEELDDRCACTSAITASASIQATAAEFSECSAASIPTSYEGTGIGLAIVKKAVARMNSAAGFESEPGCGSRFWFTLPKP